RPLPKGAMMMSIRAGQGLTLVGDLTLSGLADMLSRQLDRPVIDQTAIPGDFAISLNFVPPAGMMSRNMMPAGGMRGGKEAGAMVNGAPADATAADPAPSVFTAVQQQLGLRLDPRKGPVAILVVDSAAKMPVGQ
ncbi:MAG: TIGR03435 family protein, partial [Terriglobales bacterium]